MRQKKQKIARYILIINTFLIAVYGVMVIIQPNLFTDNLELYAEVDLNELGKTHNKLTKYIDMLIRLIGGFNILIAVVGIIAIYKSFELRKKWLLVIIFFTSILGYVTPITFDLISGIIAPAEVIEFTGLILNMVAFLIIIPEFKKAKI